MVLEGDRIWKFFLEKTIKLLVDFIPCKFGSVFCHTATLQSDAYALLEVNFNLSGFSEYVAECTARIGKK